jgi:hypothetical protein
VPRIDRQAFDTRFEMESCRDCDSEVVDALPEGEEGEGKESLSAEGAEDVEVCGEGVRNVPQSSWSCSVCSRGSCINMFMQNAEGR